MPNITTNHAVAYNNNNNDDNNNNGNFICVFECPVVNLAMYRQFTNAAANNNNNKIGRAHV